MKPSLYCVPLSASGRLFVMPKPSGEWLQDDIKALQLEGIQHVVCMLTDDELHDLDLSGEADVCRQFGVSFNRFAIEDRGVPELGKTTTVVEEIVRDLEGGKSIAVHCRAGIGRSGLLAACVLTRLGIDPEEAIETVGNARGVPIPDTEEQTEFIFSFAGQSRA